MSWKELIFQKENSGEEVKQRESIVFPDKKEIEVKVTPQLKFTTNEMRCEPYMAQVMDIYERGFESLNKEGYDFYEFYKAIIEIGNTTPDVYRMAYRMATTMGNVSKESLISQAKEYINEIEKVHAKYSLAAEEKKKNLIDSRKNKESSLRLQIEDIGREITDLETRRRELTVSLNSLSGNDELEEIECKSLANDEAKKKVISSIQQIINGIETHIK